MYSDPELSGKTATVNDTITVTVNIRNASAFSGDEVVQLYVKQPAGIEDQPLLALKAFARVYVQANKTEKVALRLPVSQLRHFEPKINDYEVAKGSYELMIGAASDDIRLRSSLEIRP